MANVISARQVLAVAKSVLLDHGHFGEAVEESRLVPTKTSVVPSAQLYLRRQQGRAAGDANHGLPNFNRSATLGIGIFTRSDSDTDAAVDAVLLALLEAPSFIALVEGVEAYDVEFEVLDEGENLLVMAALEIRLALPGIVYEMPLPEDGFEGVSVTGLTTDPLMIDVPQDD